MSARDQQPDYEGAQELLELREFLDLLDERDALREILESPNADPRLWQRLGKVNDQIQHMRDCHKTFGLEGVHWQFPRRIGGEDGVSHLTVNQAGCRPQVGSSPTQSTTDDDLYWDSDWNEPRTMKNEHEVFDNRERYEDLHISLRNYHS